MRTVPGPAFYCVADARYFIGAVAMINSLRLHGHREPVYLLDRGLTESQRSRLAAEATIVAAPHDAPPHLQKTIAPRRHPAETVVLIDTDMVLTRPLGELLERAGGNRLVAFRDRQQRHFASWGAELGLGETRPGPYVSSGLVIAGADAASELLGLMEESQHRVDYERTFWRRHDRDYPFLYADQDVLNAILLTRFRPERVVALDSRLSATPPFRHLRLLDVERLRCAYEDGLEPYVVHQFVRKPWLEPMYHGLYSRLLVRLLLEPDVAIAIDERELPLRMRSGIRARLGRGAVDARDLARFYLGDLLPGWIGERIEDRRRRTGEAR